MNEQVALQLGEPEVIVRLMLTFDRAADDFLGDCARRGFTPRTIQTYARTYRLLADRLPKDQDVSKITTDDLRRFLGAHTHLAAGTVAGFESHLSSLFRQLYLDGKIARDPVDRLIRTKRKRAEDLEVVSIDAAGVRAMLAAASSWSERLALGVLVYLGPRRHAVALLRLRDYDELHGRLRFREKGGKVFWRPIPDELRSLIDAAIAADVYADTDYLIPPEGHLARRGDRDDRVIWRLVKRVADRAGVDCHVHALRAAFACFYDEQNPGDLLALRDHMGHASSKTTEAHYLRRRDKQAGMERIRSLSWGLMSNADDAQEVDGMSYVYFIAGGDVNVDGSPVKIGYSGYPRARLATMQTGYPVKLQLVAEAPGPPELETHLHELLAADRLEGEWFRSSERLRGLILSLGNVELHVPVDSSRVAYAASRLVGAGGFEPPFEDDPHGEPQGGIRELVDDLNPRNHAGDESRGRDPKDAQTTGRAD